MGNQESSPLSICLGKTDADSMLTELTSTTPGDAWLSVPISELTDKMDELKSRSLEERETFENRVNRYVTGLTIPVDHMRKMVESFVHELEVGLDCHQRHPSTWDPKECSFKMLDACIPTLPTGRETGIFYALDFGGTNFRVVRCALSDGKLSVTQKHKSLLSALPDNEDCPKGLMDSAATAMQMFDFFAQTVKEFMVEEGDQNRTDVQCGFTFSFPCSQRKVDSAVLMCWTKGFETGRATDDPVEGLDVAELMNVAFKRNGVPIVCNALLNDTVGTLLSCAYEMDNKTLPPCMVGMILGTGMNCCYFDPTAPKFGYEGKIINIESGNFNRELPRTNIDCELDFKAIDNRGFQQLEKMCSGAYLGEICRMTLVKIFQHRSPALAFETGSLSTENIAKIMNDKSKELIVTKEVIREVWGSEMNQSDLCVVHTIATAVMDRSAALAAVLVAGCGQKTGSLQAAFGGLSVGIDGSLYKRNPWYRQRVRHHLDAILGKSRSSLIHLLQADDGSGKGASILSATVAFAN